MSTYIYTTQEKLNLILDIEQEYTIPDADLFDCSEYSNDGKVTGYIPFDRTGTTHTEEHKKHMSEKMMGRTFSETSKQKMSIAALGNKKGRGNKGVLKSIEHKKKLSEAKIGKTLSEEHKNNMRVAQKERWRLSKLK